jgi:hypothetical protein
LQYALNTTDALATSSVAVDPHEYRTDDAILEPIDAEFASCVQAQDANEVTSAGHLLSVSPWTTYETAFDAHGARAL